MVVDDFERGKVGGVVAGRDAGRVIGASAEIRRFTFHGRGIDHPRSGSSEGSRHASRVRLRYSGVPGV
jgi:hypothetical protein